MYLIEKYGVGLGTFISSLPFVYDVIGVFYGRGFWEGKISTVGYWIYVSGIVLIIVSLIIKFYYPKYLVGKHLR